MGINMDIYDWIQRNKDLQAFATSGAPEKRMNAQKLPQDGKLTVGQAV
jgi:hypothetical protein